MVRPAVFRARCDGVGDLSSHISFCSAGVSLHELESGERVHSSSPRLDDYITPEYDFLFYFSSYRTLLCDHRTILYGHSVVL